MSIANFSYSSSLKAKAGVVAKGAYVYFDHQGVKNFNVTFISGIGESSPKPVHWPFFAYLPPGAGDAGPGPGGGL